jgi:hypothetical protein
MEWAEVVKAMEELTALALAKSIAADEEQEAAEQRAAAANQSYAELMKATEAMKDAFGLHTKQEANK